MPACRRSSYAQARANWHADVSGDGTPQGKAASGFWRNRARLPPFLALLCPASAYADQLPGRWPPAGLPFRGQPLSYLQAYGERASAINTLFWFLIAVSLAVIAMTVIVLLGGIFRGRMLRSDSLPGVAPVLRARRGAIWIILGVSGTALVLFASSIWTVITLAAVSFPPTGSSNLKIEVVGHQWWWEVRYLSGDPSRVFRTANEIHVPIGEPVSFDLVAADVIHSFWIPALNGKTDLIPGQLNTTWFTAATPGVYRGQCTEYCGLQHAHMGLEVVADSPEDFKAWWSHQLEPAPAPETPEAENALSTFIVKCGACHAVRGTPAGGVVGPDLSHLMSRRTVAAATLSNTIGSLSAWISDPQHVKPGNYMPVLDISGPELTRIRSFLESLQ